MTEDTKREMNGDARGVEESVREEGEGVGSRDDDPGEDPAFPEVEEELEAEADLESELDRLQEEFEGLKDRHLRLAADFENYRRRAENEMTESWIRAQADLLRRLLDAIDDLQRVTELDPDETSIQSVLEGVELVERKLLRAMQDAGAEVVNPVGEEFDPAVMEAMMRVPAEDPGDDDRVQQVFQKGYTFKGHLVRPARVSVLKAD